MLSDGRRDPQHVAVPLPQCDERALRLDQAHHALQRVLEQQIALRCRQQPARQLDQERPEPPLPFEPGPARHHDPQVGRDLQRRAQHVGRETFRHAPERGPHVPPLGIIVVDKEGLAAGIGRAGLGGPGLVQSLVVELHVGAAGPVTQDAGRRLPEGPGLLGVSGFGQQPPNGIYHRVKLRRAKASRKYVTQRRRATT